MLIKVMNNLSLFYLPQQKLKKKENVNCYQRNILDIKIIFIIQNYIK